MCLLLNRAEISYLHSLLLCSFHLPLPFGDPPPIYSSILCAFLRLRKNFILANRMKYLRSLVQVPILDPDPPSFLLPGQLIELELAKQVKLAAMNREDSITSFGTLIEPGEVERPQRVSSPRQPEPDPTPIPRPSPPKQRPKVQSQPPPATTTTTVFDSQFSSISSTQSFDFTHTVAPAPIKRRDDRYTTLPMKDFMLYTVFP